MHVTISNLEFDLENTQAGLDELFGRINGAMKEFQVYFSHLVVDGTEVSNASREYLEQRLEDIRDVDVVILTAEQYLQQVVSIMDTFLEKAVPTMKEVADEFYGKPNDETWERFTLALQGLQSLVEIVNSVISDPSFSGKVGEFASIGARISEHLFNLRDAAEREDMTQVGDIMNYELVPFVESLHEAVGRLVDRHEPEAH